MRTVACAGCKRARLKAPHRDSPVSMDAIVIDAAYTYVVIHLVSVVPKLRHGPDGHLKKLLTI